MYDHALGARHIRYDKYINHCADCRLQTRLYVRRQVFARTYCLSKSPEPGARRDNAPGSMAALSYFTRIIFFTSLKDPALIAYM